MRSAVVRSLRSPTTRAATQQQKFQRHQAGQFAPAIFTNRYSSAFSTAAASARTLKRPSLPEPLSVAVDGKCLIDYVDLHPKTNASASFASPTIVLIHGAPGTYGDFRYLMPLLQERGARVIGVNLPGFGGSHVLDEANYYEHVSGVPSMYLVHSALETICKDDDHVFVLGHSFGGHGAVHLTAITQQENRINVKGLALLASAGFRPHRAMRPSVNAFLWQLLRTRVPFLEQPSKLATKYIYTEVLKFPGNFPHEHFANGIVRCATADYPLFDAHLKELKDLPSFIAWAQDDVLIQEEIFTEVSDICRPGPRLAFQKGGHNIQKTKADVLAKELTQWMDRVVQEKHDEFTRDVHVHP